MEGDKDANKVAMQLNNQMIGRGCDVSRLCDFIFGRCVFQQLFGMAQISMLDTGEHLLGTDSVQPLIQ